MSARPRVVAAFDFDGTLSTRDNVVPFLAEIAGMDGTARVLVRGGYALARRGRSAWTRDSLKAEVTARVLGGLSREGIERLAGEYAERIVANHLRATAVELALWHRSQGHEVVIVSASFAVYLRPVAEHLGLDAVLATELEYDDDGRCTGRLLGANVRGAEKVRRLEEYLAEHGAGLAEHGAGLAEHGAGHEVDRPAFVFAYGDSSGDRELWDRADRAVRLGRRAHLGTR
jgi:phosphatidylglycerophosphatase C